MDGKRKIIIFETKIDEMRRTRVSRYGIVKDEKFLHQLYKLALLGATDKDYAEFFQVPLTTVTQWRDSAEVQFAIRKGRAEADATVAEALYRRAIGYSVEEEHVHMYKGKTVVTKVMKNYPPDSWAAARWLSLRQRGNWTEVNRTEVTQRNININQFDFEGLTNEELKMLRQIGLKQLSQNVGNN